MCHIMRRRFVGFVILACEHALLLSPAATTPKQLFAPSWPAMSNVETIGSSGLPSVGPPSSWSIDQQLEWIIDNTTMDFSEATVPAQPDDTPGAEVEVMDVDGEDETEKQSGRRNVFSFAHSYAG